MKFTQTSFALSATLSVKITTWVPTRVLESKLVEAMEMECMGKQ